MKTCFYYNFTLTLHQKQERNINNNLNIRIMDFHELTTISGTVVYIKRPAPWNWQAIDDKGVICAAPTKRECQRTVKVLRK